MKRADVNSILNNESLDNDARAKKLLDLFHDEMDELRDSFDAVSRELEKAKSDTAAATKGKEDAENAFTEFKNQQAAKEAKSAKEIAYREMLKNAGVSEKHIGKILKITDFSGIELDDKGEFKNAKELAAAIKTDYAEFIATSGTRGAAVGNPPAGTGGTITKEEILKIKNTAERQKAIAENHELFGF